jgi:hypothetical protein
MLPAGLSRLSIFPSANIMLILLKIETLVIVVKIKGKKIGVLVVIGLKDQKRISVLYE